jgi:hypothetical protein
MVVKAILRMSCRILRWLMSWIVRSGLMTPVMVVVVVWGSSDVGVNVPPVFRVGWKIGCVVVAGWWLRLVGLLMMQL